MDGQPLIQFPPDHTEVFAAYQAHAHGPDLYYGFAVPHGIRHCVILNTAVGADFPAALVCFVPLDPSSGVAERRLALLLARGRSNDEIAASLALSAATGRHYTEADARQAWGALVGRRGARTARLNQRVHPSRHTPGHEVTCRHSQRVSGDATMPTLRLTQSTDAAAQPGHYRVEIALEGEGIAREIATVRACFALKSEDREDVRWYLEEYLQYPQDPAPAIAARIEARMAELGSELFRTIFHEENARDLWANVRPHLNDTRVEVVSSVQEAVTVPWELLRDPKTDAPLALRARAFVRAHPQPAHRPKLPRTRPKRVRILLVISRPGEGDDVPFRSVASRLIKGLSAARQDAFELDVLRPPSFDELARVLRAAKQEGHPYHVVHFDGHGVYEETPAAGRGANRATGAHGYLVFENAGLGSNADLVDGSALGRLLVEADVPVLVLNACRSAHAEALPEPDQSRTADVHTQARAFGSLAQEVMDAGVAGIVAMRYNVYVVTAAQFVADLYARLALGDALGEAVTLGRKQLAAQPHREIADDPLPLQDWVVPVVYEAAPLALFRRQAAAAAREFRLHAGDTTATNGVLDPSLPPSPDVGFFGRDETLLALDRAFDTQRVVLLHAYAGSGKTATAAEFARWYKVTGGVDGPVLFTSFEQYLPLARVLDELGRVFEKELAQHGVQWPTLTDANRRRDVALQVLRQVPVLWVWDNVEPVAGFPAGAPSPWSSAEQQELADFLRAARDTKAKFLLTSRRDERGWLGELPRRVPVPPMPMQERVQLARALAAKHGRRIENVGDWRPLLRFTEGNPLTITVLVDQALRHGVRTKEQVDSFTNQLQAGAALVADDTRQGRSKSLGASLNYGFDHAFSETERRRLALMHLFRRLVDVRALCRMGAPKAAWCLPTVRGLTHKDGVALLDRAAEVGIVSAVHDGCYVMHPALPAHLNLLFDRYYGDEAHEMSASMQPPDGRRGISSEQAKRAYVEATGDVASFLVEKLRSGRDDLVPILAAHEANLLHARQIAREHGWWYRVISAMQGLRALYYQTGRRLEWRRLVADSVPDFVDPATDAPLPGRDEEDWLLLTEYRVQIARQDRQFPIAERLQRMHVDLTSTRAQSVLAAPADSLDDTKRNQVRMLGISLHELGQIQLARTDPHCVAAFEQALDVATRINDRGLMASCANNIGLAYLDVVSPHDLDAAERWTMRALSLTSIGDSFSRATRLMNLGSIAYQRYEVARRGGSPQQELVKHLGVAYARCQEAFELLPQTALSAFAVLHRLTGNIRRESTDVDGALALYRESIRCCEQTDDLAGAAAVRQDAASALAYVGRTSDALEYARAALRNYDSLGGRDEQIESVRSLIARIERGSERRQIGGA